MLPLVAPSVLVETFEKGVSINKWVSSVARGHNSRDDGGAERGGWQPATPEEAFRDELGRLGVDTLLKMVIGHNFVHADLHPGNVLVRTSGGAESSEPSLDGVVLLDAGMTATLSSRQREELLRFFAAISDGNGRNAAASVLQFADGTPPKPGALPPGQTCPDPAGFASEMDALFATFPERSENGVTAGEFMAETLEVARRYDVRLAGPVLTVIVTSCVLEGWAIGLSPGVSVLDHVKEQMASYHRARWFGLYT